jgi:hypothetical protein
MLKIAFPVFAFFCPLVLLPTYVWAEDQDSFANYDSIVNELKASTEDAPVVRPQDDFNWEDVAIHGGIAIATSWVSLTSPDGVAGSGLLKGVEFNFGINLFTRSLRAEGAFANYAQEELDHNLKADLKEFELRLIYLPVIQENTVLRTGFGLAARYMSVDSYAGGRWAPYQASTPTSIFLVGFERKISPLISIGPDLSYRSAIVSDTYDKSAWDASFRLNATF